jgi:hypothetical protein
MVKLLLNPYSSARDPQLDVLRAGAMLHVVAFWHIDDYSPALQFNNHPNVIATECVLGLFAFISGFLLSGRSKYRASRGCEAVLYEAIHPHLSDVSAGSGAFSYLRARGFWHFSKKYILFEHFARRPAEYFMVCRDDVRVLYHDPFSSLEIQF